MSPKLVQFADVTPGSVIDYRGTLRYVGLVVSVESYVSEQGSDARRVRVIQLGVTAIIDMWMHGGAPVWIHI